MTDSIYEVLVPYLTFRGIVNTHLQKKKKSDLSHISMIIFFHSEHHLNLC